jgi:hypothetical protein
MFKKIFNFNSLLMFLLIILFSLTAQSSYSLVIVSPPRIVFDTEPELVVIPNTYVYYASKDDNDLFFYDGAWWRPWHERWYSSEIYTGPWVIVETAVVPVPVLRLPDGWRAFPPDVVRVRWGDVRLHWNEWHHDGYWEHHEWRGPYRDFDRHDRDRDRGRGREGRHR